jgi:hypothetical protein
LFIPLSEKELLETNKHVKLQQESLDKDFKVNEKIKFKIKFLTNKQQAYKFMIDFGDGNNGFKSGHTKIPPYYVGVDVPKYLDEPIVTDPDPSADPHRYNYYLYNIEFKYDAIVKGFEVYAHTGGGYYLSIFDPCNGTTIACLNNDNTQSTYIEKKRWIPNTEQLLRKGFNYINADSFSVLKTWTVYLYLNYGPAKIAWNIENTAPRSDYASKGGMQRLHPSQNWALYVRAEVDRYEEEIEFEHVYSKPGTYTVSVYEVNNRTMNAVGTINVTN